MSAASSSTNSPSPPGQGEQYLMEQQKRQLIMLIHANKCLTNHEQSCNTQYCADVKKILVHMAQCNQRNDCTVSGCAQSRSVMSHYKSCQNTNCGICAPIRMMQNNGNTYHQNPTSSPDQNWHENVDPGVRNQLVGKLTGFLPSSAATDVLNPNSIQLAARRARQIEIQAFHRAESLVAYLVHMEMLIDGARAEAPDTKGWHREVPFMERVRSVTKMIESRIGEGPAEEQKIYDLIAYAKVVEREFYEKADSPEEYIHALQNKAMQMKESQRR